MPASLFDIYIDQGSIFGLRMLVRQPDREPINWTGFTVAAVMKKTSVPDAETVMAFTAAFDEDVTNGYITLSLTALQTAALASGRYFYTLVVTSGATPVTLLRGAVIVRPEIT
jgi:hypothetical protein